MSEIKFKALKIIFVLATFCILTVSFFYQTDNVLYKIFYHTLFGGISMLIFSISSMVLISLLTARKHFDQFESEFIEHIQGVCADITIKNVILTIVFTCFSLITYKYHGWNILFGISSASYFIWFVTLYFLHGLRKELFWHRLGSNN